MGKFKYMTNRTFEVSPGKEGRVKAFVLSDSETLEGEYNCPECGKNGKINQPFRRPIIVKCQGCGYVIRVCKLKDEIKRDKKKS